MYTLKSLNEFFLKYMKVDEDELEEVCPSCFHVIDGDTPTIPYIGSDDVFYHLISEDHDLVIYGVSIMDNELYFDFMDADGENDEGCILISNITLISLTKKCFSNVKLTPFGKKKKCACNSWMVLRSRSKCHYSEDPSFDWVCFSCNTSFATNKSIIYDEIEINNDKLRWLLLNKEEE